MKGTTKEEASQTQHVDEMRERMRMLRKFENLFELSLFLHVCSYNRE